MDDLFKKYRSLEEDFGPLAKGLKDMKFRKSTKEEILKYNKDMRAMEKHFAKEEEALRPKPEDLQKRCYPRSL